MSAISLHPSQNVSTTDVQIPFNKDTFLTSLRDNVNGTSSNKKHNIVVEEPQGMVQVREEYTKLKGVVGSLSDKMSAVLAKQEKDFLAAYRAHMYKVQKELHDMRQNVIEMETSMHNNEKIHSLEEEKDWYRTEALRLDSISTSMKKDLKYMKEKLEAIEDDRNWLEKQLRNSKKQNKLLRAELEVRRGNTNDEENETSMDSSFLGSPKFQESQKLSPRDNKTIRTLEENYRESRDGQVQVYPHQEVRVLKKELQIARKEIHNLRSMVVTGKSQSTELEAFFLQCIDSVRKDILKRRKNGALLTEKSSLSPIKINNISSNKTWISSSPNPPPTTKEDSSTNEEDIFSEVIDFKRFSSTDRVHVMDRLMGDDKVLSFLYESIFPSKKKSQFPVSQGKMMPLSPSTPLTLPDFPSRHRTTNKDDSPLGNNNNERNTFGKQEGLLNEATVEYLQARRPASSMM